MKIIECDVDGVLLNVYAPVEAELHKQGINFYFKDSVRTWSMKETGPMRKQLLYMLLDANLRAQAPWYDGSITFVKYLSNYCARHNYKLVLNTHESNYEAAQVKVKKLDELRELTGVDFEANVQCSPQKEMLDSYICIDDSIENICRSTAKLPLLFNSFHNTELYNGPRKGIHRVESYTGAMGAILMFEEYGVVKND